MIIDTREQAPLEFIDDIVTAVKFESLTVGDYCAEFKNGTRPPIVFERKSLGDLFSTLGSDYGRFKRELSRAKKSGVQLILIVEGTLTKVLKGNKYSMMDGVTVVRRMFSLWIRHGLNPVFCKDRVEMARYIVEFYGAIGRDMVKKG